jgi:ankyrin repeat protein
VAAAQWSLQQGVAVNAVNNQGYTALHCVCLKDGSDETAIIEVLLANGADMHKFIELQFTALDLAAKGGNVQRAKILILIAVGADVNNFNCQGTTGLHWAVVGHHTALAQLLLEHGATAVMNSVVPPTCSSDAPCCDGMTALMMCEELEPF